MEAIILSVIALIVLVGLLILVSWLKSKNFEKERNSKW